MGCQVREFEETSRVHGRDAGVECGRSKPPHPTFLLSAQVTSRGRSKFEMNNVFMNRLARPLWAA